MLELDLLGTKTFLFALLVQNMTICASKSATPPIVLANPLFSCSTHLTRFGSLLLRVSSGDGKSNSISLCRHAENTLLGASVVLFPP